jgi:hypothetical protein
MEVAPASAVASEPSSGELDAASGGSEAARDVLAGLVRQIASIVAQLTEKSGEEKESKG